ncbi:hypothetical protein ACJOYF_18455 [Acinetobacter baumannii]
MKPEQFIREFGVEKAREVVEDAPNDLTLFRLGGIEEIPTYLKVKDGKYWRYSWRSGFREVCQSTYKKINDAGELVSISDLKLLVESLDLIKFYDGIERAKLKLAMGTCLSGRPPHPREVELRRAIRDHESIYGGGDA